MRYVILIIVALISYGSLYPFRFSGEILGASEFWAWVTVMNFQTTRSDIIANILLFMPYGFACMMALTTRARNPLLTASLVGFGVLLAFVLQYLQLYIPARVPDSVDALYNSLGIFLGMFSAHLLKKYSQGQSMTKSLLSDWSRMTIPIMLALIFILWRLYPYVPLLTADSIAQSVNPLLIKPSLDLTIVIRDALLWLMFFLLITRAPFEAMSRFKLLSLTLTLMAAEILIKNNQLTINDLLAALAAFALYASTTRRQLEQSLYKGMAIAILLLMLENIQLPDEQFTYSWLPFAAILKGSPWLSVELLLLKGYLFGCFIYLLRSSLVSWEGATFLCAGYLILLTLLQGLLTPDKGDITDPILAVVFGVAMSQFEKLASREKALTLNQ